VSSLYSASHLPAGSKRECVCIYIALFVGQPRWSVFITAPTGGKKQRNPRSAKALSTLAQRKMQTRQSLRGAQRTGVATGGAPAMLRRAVSSTSGRPVRRGMPGEQGSADAMRGVLSIPNARGPDL